MISLRLPGHSLTFPFQKVGSEVLLQFFELIPEHSPTSPAPVVSAQVGILIRNLSPGVVLCQWEVFEGNEEIGVEGVVVLPVLHTVSAHIWTDDVNV